MSQLRRLAIGIVFAVSATASLAQIKIGQTTGLTGQVAASVTETVAGAKLYFDAVNAKGGIGGQKIELFTLDDQFDVKKTPENGRILIEEKKVIALFLNRGTPHTESLMPLLAKYGIPLIAPSTGAIVLHKPVNQYIFNVRSSYQREVEKVIDHFHTTQIERIALVHVDDSFGADALAGAEAAFSKNNMKPVAVIKADRSKPDYSTIIPALIKAQPQTILWAASGTAVAEGVKALRAAGSNATVATLSNNASGGFIKQLGDKAEGVIVAQVFPSERSVTYAMVREAQQLAAASKQSLSPAMLEGFAGAKVLVEGLRRAGANPTSERLIRALNTLNNYDLGGFFITYKENDHTGLDFADLSIIGRDGKFRR